VIFRALYRLLLFLVLLVLGRLLGRYVSARLCRSPSRRPAGPSRLPAEDTMVRDRICNTFVPRRRALVERRGGEESYFCSERCRRAFLERSAPGRTGAAGL
jgi:YHS domain-containing protein